MREPYANPVVKVDLDFKLADFWKGRMVEPRGNALAFPKHLIPHVLFCLLQQVK